MGCYFPVGTYKIDGTQVYRPCGKCRGCRLEYARTWAVRCVHEASLCEDNSFITLTYNNENLPRDGSLKKKHFQKFIKRLRKKIEPTKIRYFGCGEYGTKFKRPHYHVCVFGYQFTDLEVIKFGKKTRFRNRFKTGNDHTLYTSAHLEKLWKKGYSTIGELTFESAGYCARYITKKIVGEMSSSHYKKRHPEFALMSRAPGLGAEWIDQYMSDVYPKDFHTLNGIKMRPNRFYDMRYKKRNPKGFAKVKATREAWQKKYGDNPAVGLSGYHNEKFRKNVTKSLKRSFENDER